MILRSFFLLFCLACVQAQAQDDDEAPPNCPKQLTAQSVKAALANVLATREALLSQAEAFSADPDDLTLTAADDFLAKFTLMPLQPGSPAYAEARDFNRGRLSEHLVKQHATAIERWINTAYPNTQVNVDPQVRELLFRPYLRVSGKLEGVELGSGAALLIPDFKAASSQAELQLSRYLQRMGKLHALGFGIDPGRRLVAGRPKHWIAQLIDLSAPVVWGDALPAGFDTTHFIQQLVPMGAELEEKGLLLMGRVALAVSPTGVPVIVDFSDYGRDSESAPSVDTHWGSLTYWYDRFNAENLASHERTSLGKHKNDLLREWETIVGLRDKFEKLLLVAVYASNTISDDGLESRLTLRSIRQWLQENAPRVRENLQAYSSHVNLPAVRPDSESVREFREIDRSFDSRLGREAHLDRLVSVLASALRVLEETRTTYVGALNLPAQDAVHTWALPTTLPSREDYDWSRRMVDWEIDRSAENERLLQCPHLVNFVHTVARAWRRLDVPTYPKTFVFFVSEWSK